MANQEIEKKDDVELVETETKKATKEAEVEEDKPISTQLKDVLEEWCWYSSAIPIMQFMRASCWLIRIMWIVVFLASIGASGYFVIISLIQYYQNGVINQITISKQYPTYFPAVTICNLNPFNNNRSSVYIDTLLAANNQSDFISITNTDALEQSQGSNNTIQLLDDLLDKLRRWVATDATLTNVTRRNLGFELKSDMLKSCSFNGKSCSDTDFWYSRNYAYGNCFTFNSGFNSAGAQIDLLQTSKTGAEEGLRMELMVGNPTEEVRFVYKTGIFVMVHNQSFTPLQVGEYGVFLPTGFDSYVSINRQFYTKLPFPYSTCIDDYTVPPNDYGKKLYGYMSDAGATVYSQDFCNSICYQDQVIDKCGCADPSLPALRSASYCSNSSQITCQDDFEKTFSAANLDTQCQNGCPMKCSTVTYALSLTNAMYPSTYYQTLMQTKAEFTEDFDFTDTSATEYIRESVVKVTINYESLQYEQITEYALVTVDALFGNIGGIVGLFIGITFLSVFEIFHLLIDFARTYILYRKKKNNTVNPVI